MNIFTKCLICLSLCGKLIIIEEVKAMDGIDKDTQIPIISGARIGVNKEDKSVNCEFLCELNKDEDTSEVNVVGRLIVPFEDYQDFAMSFLLLGLQVEEAEGVDLGIGKEIKKREGDE